MIFFKNFFKNAKADPTSTIFGLLKLAGAAGMGYAMATGKVPVDSSTIGVMGAITSSGIQSVGSNSNTGDVIAANAKIAAGMTTVIGAAAPVLDIVNVVNQAKQEAVQGQSKVDTYAAIAASLAPLLAQNAADGDGAGDIIKQ
jgi:hypothetical protein